MDVEAELRQEEDNEEDCLQGVLLICHGARASSQNVGPKKRIGLTAHALAPRVRLLRRLGAHA
eukprot:4433060-Pyramimonas_sp.AAC.1